MLKSTPTLGFSYHSPGEEKNKVLALFEITDSRARARNI